ncbi:MAG: EAL domain-containing protein [Caldimicrobium thiodismutans]
MEFLLIGLTLDSEGHILTCNRNFLKLTGYSLEELRGKKLCDFLFDAYCREKFEKIWVDLKETTYNFETIFIKKDKSPLYVQGKIKRVLKDSRRYYLLSGSDITVFKTLERGYKLVRTINTIITKASNEEEVFEKLGHSLVEDLGLRFVWVGVPDFEKGYVKPLFRFGYEEGFLDEIRIPIDPTLSEGKDFQLEAIRERRIIINPDTRSNQFFTDFRESYLQRGYFSGLSIPLYINGELRYLLTLFSHEPFYFDLIQEELFKELKEDLEFALERIIKEQNLKLISTALENSDLCLIITDEKGKILYVNPEVCLITGYLEEELIGKSVNFLLVKDSTSEGQENIEFLFEEFKFPTKVMWRRKDGEIIYVEQKAIPVDLEKGKRRIVFVGRDLTLITHLIESLEKEKEYDPLTGALTLRALIEKTKLILPHLKSQALFIVLDLYQFTYFNDLYGFSAGDKILRTLTERFKKTFENKGYIARVSADEFLIFLIEFAIAFSDLIELIITTPIKLDKDEIILKYNLGIAIYPLDGEDPEELYLKASSACKLAYKEGPNKIKFYQPEINLFIKSTLDKERLIEEALKNNYFHFYFQPYFDMQNYLISGAEALIRIIKPDGEIIPPSVFIETLEKSIYRRDFEVWAIKSLVQKVNNWKIPLGLNLYPDTFSDKTFWEEVSSDLETLEGQLVLEITERGFIKNPEEIVKLIYYLKERFPKLKLALDDFGTGYSSLNYLRRIPLDYLKVDLTFIREIHTEDKIRGIVKTIIDLAHILGAKALAEGVETQEQLQILDIMGCDFVQGFYFSKPLSEEEFIKKYLLKKIVN